MDERSGVVERPGIALVLGGARSGKSEAAEEMAAKLGAPVAYVATAADDGGDPGWAERIAAHRSRRPADWETVELGSGADLGQAIRGIERTVLVDSLGTWVAGIDGFDPERSGATDSLLDALAWRGSRRQTTVLVTEEVGLGVHPSTEAGGTFRDALGTLNRRVAGVADHVYLVVAGRVLRLP